MNKEWRKMSRRANKESLLESLKEKYDISEEDMERLAKM
jgi:hypothetical protein